MTDETPKKKAKKVTDAELWQLRALDAQQGRLQVEMKLLQKQGQEVQEHMQKFLDSLREKYGDAQVSPDGKLIYDNHPRPLVGVPGKPDVPAAPGVEEEEDDGDEED